MKRLRAIAFLILLATLVLTVPKIAQARHFTDGCDAEGGSAIPYGSDLEVLTACMDFVADSSDWFCAMQCGEDYVCDSADGCSEVTGNIMRHSSVTLHCKRPNET